MTLSRKEYLKIKVFNPALQRKLLQNLSNKISILHIPAWLPPNNEPQTPTPPCPHPPPPISRLIFKLEQNNKSKHARSTAVVCHRERLPSARKELQWEADGKEAPSDSPSKLFDKCSFYVATQVWKSAHWLVQIVHNVTLKIQLMESILRGEKNTFQMICVGGIPFQAMILCAICHKSCKITIFQHLFTLLRDKSVEK